MACRSVLYLSLYLHLTGKCYSANELGGEIV